MNDKQKELLEDIQLKTIDLMIKDKNLNVLAIIKDCKDKSLFFDEFYEVIFVKLVTQFEITDFVKISIRYENFNLNPLKASQLMNESIKYSGQEFTSYCNFQNIDFVMKSLHENTLYLDDYNMNRLQNSINVSKSKLEHIEKNEKIKNYLNLDNKLEEKNINTKKYKL